MEQVSATKTVHTVSQFLNWQRSGVLALSPGFQRRAVWKPAAKSLLIDSVVRGFPVPVVLLRQVQDVKTLGLKMEVVDGQQRLRTLLSFIDPVCLGDFNPERDKVVISKNHNEDLAGKPFARLPDDVKHAILSYEISTHVFPASTGDALIYRIFARLNSTGLSLKPQEIRNSEFHGEFKSLVYDLSFETLDLWRSWGVFTADALARMDEAEAISDLIITMREGIKGKSQPYISKAYRDFDPEDSLPKPLIVRKRFTAVMSAVDSKLGAGLRASEFSRPALFYSLFTAIYDHMYGLASSMDGRRPRSLPSNLSGYLLEASSRISAKKLTVKVQDAMDKATADKARREVRHNFIMRALHLESAR